MGVGTPRRWPSRATAPQSASISVVSPAGKVVEHRRVVAGRVLRGLHGEGGGIVGEVDPLGSRHRAHLARRPGERLAGLGGFEEGAARTGGERGQGLERAGHGESAPHVAVELGRDHRLQPRLAEELAERRHSRRRPGFAAEEDASGRDPHLAGAEHARREEGEALGDAALAGRRLQRLSVADAVLQRHEQAAREKAAGGRPRDRFRLVALHEDEHDVRGTERTGERGGADARRPHAARLVHDHAVGGDGLQRFPPGADERHGRSTEAGEVGSDRAGDRARSENGDPGTAGAQGSLRRRPR